MPGCIIRAKSFLIFKHNSNQEVDFTQKGLDQCSNQDHKIHIQNSVNSVTAILTTNNCNLDGMYVCYTICMLFDADHIRKQVKSCGTTNKDPTVFVKCVLFRIMLQPAQNLRWFVDRTHTFDIYIYIFIA